MSEKKVYFLSKILIKNCVYYKRRGYKMNTSSHAVLAIVSGNIYFKFIIFIIHGGKMQFPAFIKIFSCENQFLIIFMSFFSTYNFVPGRGCFFLVSKFTKKYFNEKMISLAGLNKELFNSCKKTNFGNFWRPRSTFKVDFLKVLAKLRKILGHFPGGG